MPFVCADYPEVGATGELLEAIGRAGADIIEVGIPFSDPIADGPVIAGAMHEALTKGSTPGGVLEQVKAARSQIDAGLVAMVTVSIVQRVGVDEFMDRATDAGFDGLIVPDLPIEEADELRASCDRAGLSCSFLVSPTSPPERMRAIAAASTGFVYLLARVGITGERSDAPDVSETVSRLRDSTDLPIACGFGLSTAAHVRAVGSVADAAIVGSALVRHLGEAGGLKHVTDAAHEFVRALRAGTDRSASTP